MYPIFLTLYVLYVISIILLANPNLFSFSMLFVLCTLLHYPWSCYTLFSVMHSSLPTFDLPSTIRLLWNMLFYHIFLQNNTVLPTLHLMLSHC